MTAKNTLQDFYRSPKLYVGLPSGGAFYDEDVIDWPENNELPVLAMTPKDDLIVRNPDALLNGDAVIRLIRSCVPSIKKPEQIIAPDMELLLVAIRAASESEKAVKIEYKCTECESSFADKYYLKHHVSRVHLTIKPLKKLICKECETPFEQKQHLEHHMNKVHLNVKPYECNFCEKAFFVKVHLKTHLKRSHGE